MSPTFLFLCLMFITSSYVVCIPPNWISLLPKNGETESPYTFEMYERDFLRSYSAEERQLRKIFFERRLADAIAHNSDSTRSWKKGINQFSDRTDAELLKLNGYGKASASKAKLSNFVRAPVVSNVLFSEIPKSVDWRDAKVVSAVKDQGHCGSCWSFAAAEAIESHWALHTGQLWTLSEQNILDCTINPRHCGGTGGCEGATFELAFEAMANQTGIASEWTYPYVSHEGTDQPSCRFNNKTTPIAAKVTGYVKLPVNQYEPLMLAVAIAGPVAITLDASTWHSYEGGVYDGCNQTNPDLDHGVLLVGYGTDPTLGDYWLIRNSWTPVWGENGYIRLRRTSNEGTRCGWDVTPSHGVACEGETQSQYVCGTCGLLYDAAYPTVN